MAFVCGYASCRQRREVTPGTPALFISLEKDRIKSLTKSGYLSVQLPGEMGTPGIYRVFEDRLRVQGVRSHRLRLEWSLNHSFHVGGRDHVPLFFAPLSKVEQTLHRSNASRAE